MDSPTLRCRLPLALMDRVQAEARRRGLSPSALVRQILQAALGDSSPLCRRGRPPKGPPPAAEPSP